MIVLAAYKPHRWNDLAGHLISTWTRSPYSHVEVVINGVCHSSSLRDGGVRAKRIDLDKPHWDTVQVPWQDADKALRVFKRYQGQPYGWADLVFQHVLRLPVDDPGFLCSELAALMLGLPPSVALGMSPGALFDYCVSKV